MLYFFSEYNYRGNHAGTKARNDVEQILQEVNAKAINNSQCILYADEKEAQIYSSVRNKVDLHKLFARVWRVKRKKVFVQYPMLAFDFQKEYFKTISRNNELILLIHDLHSLRIPDDEKLEQEIDLLNMADTLIVHNRFMEQKIRKLGVNVPKVYCLEMFDYLCDDNLTKECIGKKDNIAFAGNLKKSTFLLDMIKNNLDVTFKLYGLGWSDDLISDNVKYGGSFKPEIIPQKIEGAFGLVWDGKSIVNCEGPLGEYTKINNPHKCSLYIAAGLPVIVWKDAAVAEFVEKNHIGITVRSIDQLKEILGNISTKEYEVMKENVLKQRKKIIHGEFLKRILKQL